MLGWAFWKLVLDDFFFFLSCWGGGCACWLRYLLFFCLSKEGLEACVGLRFRFVSFCLKFLFFDQRKNVFTGLVKGRG